ncbi:hypothetical protein L2E82_09181 [Cichorium intybus]|uniref:Uncharacterized protein n=1 Tax=Cichorium intybus TaxID=13427 RepID=A0ACB9G7Q9_CICIN|nr:hypothetical protein L2E82_09181 [Cichorium intybus]
MSVSLSPSKEAIDLIGSFGSCERCSINDGSNDPDPPSSMVGRSRSHLSNQVKEISYEKQRLRQSDHHKAKRIDATRWLTKVMYTPDVWNYTWDCPTKNPHELEPDVLCIDRGITTTYGVGIFHGLSGLGVDSKKLEEVGKVPRSCWLVHVPLST